jgi:small multidrug resistance pump
MEWIFMIFAILTEVAGTTAMKLSRGFSRIAPSIAMGAFYIISFVLLNLALKKINLSVAFAIWSGASTALLALVGFAWFKEPMNAIKIVSLVLIILGVMGLELGNEIK